MEPGPAAGDNYDSIVTALQKAIPEEVGSQGANTLATISDMVKEAVEQLLRAVSIKVQVGISSEMYNAVEHVVLDHIRTAVLGATINNPVDQYLKGCKRRQSSRQ